tara:strand:+ start:11723 stop:13207 length:1485 start_codon:yes stop_codon:yes gene_type:complete
MIRALLLILVSLIIPESEHSCIISKDSRDISRNIFTYPETIQSDNFVIHFTESNADSQLVNGQWSNLQCNRGYAQSILDHAEAALSIYLQDGWENIPPDCDESITDLNSTGHCINFGGNSLYDIYLSNDGVGMVVPETPYPVEPYTGGYTSYMKISTLLNQYESIPSWSYHVVAHELHHSIQLRYGYSVSGNFGNYMYNGWLFEQTATYMENVIYPNSIHLSTMLGNCNVVTPLTYPHYNIDYPSEIYPYRSALWQKFLVESLEDSSIIREIWEAYGLEYSTGNPVSLFPIYNDAIELITENEINLSDAYLDYAIWRYFTGERSIPNQFFNESSTYCTASTISEFEGTFYLLKNKGASKYINLPSENLDLIITSDYIEDINLSHLIIGENNSMDIIQLVPENNNFYINISNTDSNIIVANSNFNDINSSDVSFAISIQSEILGDVNGDFLVNVQDIVIAVDLALNNEYVNLADLNSDNYIDILDIVQLINLILE